jgi:3-phenylpropionate/cinnamic acid dioxygenase small subunit
MPMSSETAICNLLYRYAELMDSGRFDRIADELFSHARLIVGPEGSPTLDAQQMLDVFKRTTIRYEDGTPRTKHMITNPIVEVDEEAGSATCRSYYTVFQQTDSLPLQPVVSGRYHDRFERVDGHWRFVERDYTMVDLVGDISAHLTYPLHPAGD